MAKIFMFSIFTTYLFVIAFGRLHFPFINYPYPNDKFNEQKPIPLTENAGEPLFLTPLIEENLTAEARSAAEVHLEDFKNVTSYSGYFTVDKDFESNMFFWFFPSENNYETDPVLLWLQGGPGASGTFGLFAENGPFMFTKNGDIELRKVSWTKNHSVIYVDNPVGTGYSFTKPNGYAQNETKVGESLYSTMQQFYMIFPELLNNGFYITGESYAGKYIPALAYTIYKKNTESAVQIPLKGIAIGNGLSDPGNQLIYSDYLYQLGLIDFNAKTEFQQVENLVKYYLDQEDYINATNAWDSLVNGDFNGGKTLFANRTGFINYFNFLYPVDQNNEEYLTPFLQQPNVRKAIHVGNLSIHDGDDTVESFLREDIIQSVAPWVSELLSNYRVLVYNGQLDIIVAYPLTANYLQKLEFSGSEEYKTASRKLWYVGDDLAGYVKQAGNLTEILVRNSGHMVPADQPEWAYDMIFKFVRNLPIA